MCPGLTSPGAKMTPNIEKDTVVAIMAEGWLLGVLLLTFCTPSELSSDKI